MLSPAMPATNGSANAIFVRSLRLLDLDQRDDWPGLTVETLSTKNAQQNQKHRIQCVEWALYRLFEIWDPEGTKDVGLEAQNGVLQRS